MHPARHGLIGLGARAFGERAGPIRRHLLVGGTPDQDGVERGIDPEGDRPGRYMVVVRRSSDQPTRPRSRSSAQSVLRDTKNAPSERPTNPCIGPSHSSAVFIIVNGVIPLSGWSNRVATSRTRYATDSH